MGVDGSGRVGVRVWVWCRDVGAERSGCMMGGWRNTSDDMKYI